jgi:hypothetical protein
MTMALFVILQLADLVTTLWFLSHGVREGNPLVAFAMSYAGVFGLVFIKVLGVGMAMLIRNTRYRLLQRVNVVYALLALWNLFVIAGT